MEIDNWRTNGKTESVFHCQSHRSGNRFLPGMSIQWSQALWFFPPGGLNVVLFTGFVLSTNGGYSSLRTTEEKTEKPSQKPESQQFI